MHGQSSAREIGRRVAELRSAEHNGFTQEAENASRLSRLPGNQIDGRLVVIVSNDVHHGAHVIAAALQREFQ